ncbi:MAG: histidine phosphatase family protein [Burkholderiales bacterium]|nr:histidine phosphatase family protein [Burkholderiales bacterium]
MYNRFKRYKIILLILSLNIFGVTYSIETLRFTLDLIRHGDRVPLNNLPKDAYKWPDEELGQLTPKGMQQEYNLGVLLGLKYRLFLPQIYKPSFLYVRSTDFDRTLTSAEAVLLGLYPLGTGPEIDGHTALPHGFQAIPIHTVPQTEDKLLLGNKQIGFESVVKTYVYDTGEWRDKIHQYESQLIYWSKISGLSLGNMLQLPTLADNLYIRKLYGIPMPEGITSIDEQQISVLSTWVVTTIYNNDKVASYASADLRREIKEQLIAISKKKNVNKSLIFVAHETTLMPLLSALGDKQSQIPPYASDLNIQLLEKENNTYIVRVSLNNQLIILKACGNSDCPLAKFMPILVGK